MNERIDWVRLASMIFCIIAGIAAAYIIFKYIFGLVLPFLLGAGIAAVASTLAGKLKKHTQASKKALSVAVLLFLLCSVAGMGYLAIDRLVAELGRLADGMAKGEGGIADVLENASDLLSELGNGLSRMLPFLEGNTEKINVFLEDLLGSILSSLGSAVPGLLSTVIAAVPGLLLALAVTVISAFYFTLDGSAIKRGIRALLPRSAGNMLICIKKEAAAAAAGYLRSYSLILLITFAELFFGLSVLGAEYAFLIAAITAVIDILPVLGVGIVLLPWALYSLICRDIFLGAGLIILYVITVVVRQYIEPKIVGESLGLHPLLTLAAFYLGYSLFGFAGIIIAPVLLVAWRVVKGVGDVTPERS